MNWDWDLSDEECPQIHIGKNHVDGLSEWLNKISELVPKFGGEWSVVIADLWPNDEMSRLIGHVQKKDVAIGYDTGFRVCAYLENGGIMGDDGDDSALVKQWLESAATDEKTNKSLHLLNNSNSFEVRLTFEGEGEVSEGIEIKY